MNTKKKRKGKVKHCTVSCTSEMVVKQSLCRPQGLYSFPQSITSLERLLPPESYDR